MLLVTKKPYCAVLSHEVLDAVVEQGGFGGDFGHSSSPFFLLHLVGQRILV